MATPRRGEVWLVDLGMTAKVRPALVTRVPATDADRALVINNSAIREILLFRYRLMYRVESEQVGIVAFVHGARDFATWRQGPDLVLTRDAG